MTGTKAILRAFDAITELVFARDERRVAELRDLYVEFTGPTAGVCITPATCKAVGCQRLCAQQDAIEAVTP